MPKKPHHSPASQGVEHAWTAVLKRRPELAPRARLLLGCSAGGDSMALLDLCARIAPVRRWKLAVVHIDHAQRAASRAEAEFVAHQAGGRGIDFFSDRLLAATSRLSEDAMRRVRQEVYQRFYKEWKAGALLLAHQADDLAETVLMRLLSGAGATGLSGIQAAQTMNGMRIVRPLLKTRREDLRQYLRERELPWHDDPSNADERYKRNWVRETVLPLLTERLGHDPTDHLTGASELLAAESEAMREAAALLLEQIADGAGAAQINLAHPIWKGAGEALRRQLVREWLWRNSGGYPPGAAAVEQVLEFIKHKAPGKALRTSGGQTLRRIGNRLVLQAKPEPKSANAADGGRK